MNVHATRLVPALSQITRRLFAAGAVLGWLSLNPLLAQLTIPALTVAEFAGNTPGAYNNPDWPWEYVSLLETPSGEPATGTPFRAALPTFQDIKLRTQWGRIEVTATYEVSFTVGAGGVTTVEVAMPYVVLRLSSSSLADPIELPLAAPTNPLRLTVDRNSNQDVVHASMTRSRSFNIAVADGLSDLELSLEWATSTLTSSQGTTILDLGESIAGKVDGTVAVPEPETFAVATGLVALAHCLRRRRASPAR